MTSVAAACRAKAWRRATPLRTRQGDLSGLAPVAEPPHTSSRSGGAPILTLTPPAGSERTTMTEPCLHSTGLPFVYDSPGEARDILQEVSHTAAAGVAETSRGNQFNAKDRADQDRYLAGEFRSVGERAYVNQKDRTDHERWLGVRFEQLAKDVERNGRSAELATEKIGAATILAVEKTAAATLLDAAKNAAAAALCCCEVKEAISASNASVLAAIKQAESDALRQQLTVFQIRAGVLAAPA